MTGSAQQVLKATTHMAALRARPEMARYLAIELIKAGRRGAVFSGYDRDRRVVIKLHYGAEGREEAAAAARAMMRLEAWMDAGADRVPLLLDHLAEDGVIVAEFAPGVRLDRLMAERPHDRAALIARAATWLTVCSGHAAAREAFQGRFWIKSRAASLEGLEGPDADMAQRLLSEISGLRDRLAGREFAKYYAHGDWAPHNMIVDGDTVFGVDIAVRRPILRAKDIARFLVYLVAHVPGPAPLCDGVPVGDLEAMSRLPEAGDAQLMRFFIGVELADKFARNHGRDAVSSRVRGAIGPYLDAEARPQSP
ncbi:MAG: phosphotransferase [Pseudomonadota bacterium]